VAGMIVHPGRSFDHHRHPREGSQVRTEAVCPGTLPQRSIDLLELPVVQLRLAPRAARTAQGGGTALPPFGVPAADAPAAHRQFTGDLRVGHLASGEEADGSFSPQFQTCKISSGRSRCVHALFLQEGGQNVDILCDRLSLYYATASRFRNRPRRFLLGQDLSHRLT
jgi:hypothetical protein